MVEYWQKWFHESEKYPLKDEIKNKIKETIIHDKEFQRFYEERMNQDLY